VENKENKEDSKQCTVPNYLNYYLNRRNLNEDECFVGYDPLLPIDRRENINITINNTPSNENVENNKQDLTPFINKDGSVKMDESYEPKEPKDVSTKEYVDSEISNLPKIKDLKVVSELPEASKENYETLNYVIGDGLYACISSATPPADDNDYSWEKI